MGNLGDVPASAGMRHAWMVAPKPLITGWGLVVSLVQSSVASALPFLRRTRRMVVVSVEDAEHLATAIGFKAGERVEVVRTIRLGHDLRDENLPPGLSIDALRRDGISGIVVANGDH